MIISGRQIRGARGLLGWSMEQLAERAEITVMTLRHIENDVTQPQEKTLAAIYSVLDRRGIDFLEDDGVKMRKQEMRKYSGKTGYRQFLDHVYETLKEGGRIRQFNFGDLRYLPYEENFVTEHLKRMETIEGLDAKVLETGDETENPVSYCEYRYLDKKFKDMAPWYLYGDYLVLSLFETGAKREFVTIHSKLLAERYVKEFDIFWDMAESHRKKKAK
jgi:transcriptional regulator with XRE-family HTH domain